MIDINLHEYKDQLRLKNEKGVVYIFDIIRRKYLVLQPEELVRQLLIHYLIGQGYPKEKIQVEKVKIDQATFDQMANYNLVVRAPYLLACNGVQTYCCKLNYDDKKIEHLNYIPKYS